MNKENVFIFGMAVLILMAAVFVYRKSFDEMKEYAQWTNHTQEVISSFEKLSGDLKSAQMVLSDAGRDHRNALSELFRNDILDIPRKVNYLKSLVRDNIPQQSRLDSIYVLYRNNVEWVLQRKIQDTAGLAGSSEPFKNILRTQRYIEDGIAQERALLLNRKENLQQSTTKTEILTMTFTVSSFLLILGIGVSNLYLVRRRQSLELFLESVLNTSRNGIITYAAIRKEKKIEDFAVIFANDSTEKQLGYKPSDLLGKTFRALFPALVKSGVLDKHIAVVETGAKDEFDTFLENQNTVRWYHVSLAKLNEGLTATFYDITEVRNYQEELQKKVELLEHTNSELEQFAYVASHDLQEPLRKIKTFASLINERFNEPSASSAKIYLSKVIDSADRMSNLISDLLNLSYLSNEQESFVPTDLNQVLRNIMSDFELIIEEKKAEMIIEQLPTIQAIPLQMNQLFYNLVNNALKFTKPGIASQITVTCRKLGVEDIRGHSLHNGLGYYEIVVADTGIGFKPEYSEKIFVIFQRLHNRSAYAGSGIGLALCRKIVLNHHGEIFARSKENEGAAFHLILPQSQPENLLRQVPDQNAKLQA